MNQHDKRHFLFFLGHPAHFHMFRPMMKELLADGHRLSIVARPKDVLIQLLDTSSFEYHVVPGGSRKAGFGGIFRNLVQKFSFLRQFCRINRPDVMLGTSAEIAWVGRMQGIPSLVFSEDDAAVIPYFAWLAYPFAHAIVSPDGCNNGRWQKKTITYPGYQKLAYLHPNRFKPDQGILEKYIPVNSSFSILRFSSLLAHHDVNAKGFTADSARETIRILLQSGKVYISSEAPLDAEFEPYKLRIAPQDMHHVLAFANAFAGDSQSMTVEAALLGVPAFRLSSFKGKISVLEELEHRYGLTHAFDPENPDELYAALIRLATDPNSREKARLSRDKMLSEKKDVTAFFLETAFRYSG